MGSAARSRRTVSFSDCTLDLQTAELRRDGKTVILQDQPFQILTALLETPGQLVTRETLVTRLWPTGTFVDFEQSLNKAVARLREVLGDSAEHPRFIETLPRRGYRFIAPLKEDEPKQLNERDAGADHLHLEPDSHTPMRGTEKPPHHTSWVGISIAVGIILFVVLARFLHSPARVNSAKSTAIAVLPFQNASSDKDLDFLRFALPDQVVAAMSSAPSLAIRPSALTSKYIGPDLDLQKAGSAMQVAKIITGHYLKEGDHLQVTLEAVEVENNRVIWHDTLPGDSLDMIRMQEKITGSVRVGLLTVLGISAVSSTMTHPHDEKAYDSYLHSISMSVDPGVNREAIALLESSVAADPDFAPAWEALGLRYDYAAAYGNGGKEMMDRSDAAYERALALDPNRIVAAGQLITNRVERRETEKAYQVALRLVAAHPDSAQAHFVLSYVYRYSGMLDSSAKECNTALALDPGNHSFRSCAWTFMELGQIARARDFLRLDAGSDWSAYGMATALIDEGKVTEAREVVQTISSNPYHFRDLLLACLQNKPGPDLDRFADQATASLAISTDPEALYYQGALLAYCGKEENSVQLLAAAVSANYCAHTAFQTDPLLAKLRATPAYHQLLIAATQCEQSFAAQLQ